MSGLGYGAAPFAEIVGDGESVGEIDVHLLAKYQPELARDYLNVMQDVRAFMAQHQQRQVVELREKLDELILTARQKTAAFNNKSDEAYNAANAHMAAEQLASQYGKNASNLRYEIANSRELLTTSEKERRLAKLRELEQLHQQAVLAESAAFSQVRNRKYEADAALAEAKSANAAARDAEAQLAALTGDNSASSVRFSTTTGFQM